MGVLHGGIAGKVVEVFAKMAEFNRELRLGGILRTSRGSAVDGRLRDSSSCGVIGGALRGRIAVDDPSLVTRRTILRLMLPAKGTSASPVAVSAAVGAVMVAAVDVVGGNRRLVLIAVLEC